MTFSEDVLNYLAVVVAAQSVSGDRPDFDEAAALLGKTRRELLAAIDEIEPKPNREQRRAAAKANGRAKTDAPA